MDKVNFFYANSSAVGISAWDVSFIFERVGLAASMALNVAAQGSQQATSQLDRFDVAMSPGQAKLFAASALASILQTEKNNGAFPMPAEELKKYETFITAIRTLTK